MFGIWILLKALEKSEYVTHFCVSQVVYVDERLPTKHQAVIYVERRVVKSVRNKFAISYFVSGINWENLTLKT